MRRYVIYLYWLLLLVPTIAVGVGAFLALRREDQRRQQAEREASERLAREKATVFADKVRYNLQVTQRELMYDLVNFPAAGLPEHLRQWEQQNPLVRNVFIWQPHTGLSLPDPRQPGTREQTRFLLRYEALLTGRGPWLAGGGQEEAATPDKQPAAQSEAPAADEGQAARPVGPPAPRPAPGQQARNSATKPRQQAAPVQQRLDVNLPPVGPPNRTGWVPWYADNQLHLLGWASADRDGTVRGVELEMAAFVARLYQATAADAARLASAGDDGVTSCVLFDGDNREIYRQGPVLDAGRVLAAAVPAGGDLPHWEVRCAYQPPAAAGRSGPSFLAFGMLLTGILMAAILVGGSLLLRQARREAAEALRKTSFVSNVSHELKTPLTSIRMYAELLTSRRVNDADKQHKYLDIIVAECQRLTRLVNNVLDFSRLEQGRKQYHFEAIPVAAFVDDLIETHALRLQEAGLQPRRQYEVAATLAVRADRDAIEQILTNLLDNACKYGQTGGDLTIQLTRAGTTCRLCVMDRGPGVPPAHAERVFEKFHRVDDSLSRPHEGVGLGLSIARRLARGQDGDLTYEPRPGGGAAFAITLPIVEET